MTIKKRPGTPQANQKGFSFIELIIALAITALLMLVFLQSTLGLVEISARTSAATQNAIADSVSQQQFQSVVGGLAPAWPEQAELVFIGEPDRFSGLSRTALQAIRENLSFIEYQLVNSDGHQRLTYNSPKKAWQLRTLNAENAAFSYLGADGTWRESWPPAENPRTGPFDDEDYYPVPQLPLAVRLVAGQEVWIANVKSAPRLPVRPEDALGE